MKGAPGSGPRHLRVNSHSKLCWGDYENQKACLFRKAEVENKMDLTGMTERGCAAGYWENMGAKLGRKREREVNLTQGGLRVTAGTEWNLHQLT